MSDVSLSDNSYWSTSDLNAIIENYSTDGTEAGIDFAKLQSDINAGTLAAGINQEDAIIYVAISTSDFGWVDPDVSLSDTAMAAIDEMRRDTAPYDSLAEFHAELVSFLESKGSNTDDAINDAAILIEEFYEGIANSDAAATDSDSNPAVVTNIVQLLMMMSGGNIYLALMGMAMGWDPEYTITEEDVAAGEITLADGSTIDLEAKGYEVGGTITFENASTLETFSNAAMEQAEGLTEDSEAIQEYMEDYPESDDEDFAEQAKLVDISVQDFQTRSSLRMDIIDTLQKFKDELTQMISEGEDSMQQTVKSIIANF